MSYQHYRIIFVFVSSNLNCYFYGWNVPKTENQIGLALVQQSSAAHIP